MPYHISKVFLSPKRQHQEFSKKNHFFQSKIYFPVILFSKPFCVELSTKTKQILRQIPCRENFTPSGQSSANLQATEKRSYYGKFQASLITAIASRTIYNLQTHVPSQALCVTVLSKMVLSYKYLLCSEWLEECSYCCYLSFLYNTAYCTVVTDQTFSDNFFIMRCLERAEEMLGCNGQIFFYLIFFYFFKLRVADSHIWYAQNEKSCSLNT